MTTQTDNRVLRRRDVPGNRIGEDFVIFDDRVGKYYATGPVGADIWEMLADPVSLEEICTRLGEAYAIDAQTCKTQTKDFLAFLESLDLLEQEPG